MNKHVIFFGVVFSILIFTALPSFAENSDIIDFSLDTTDFTNRGYGFVYSVDGETFGFIYVDMDFDLGYSPSDLQIFPCVSRNSAGNYRYISIGYTVVNPNITSFTQIATVHSIRVYSPNTDVVGTVTYSNGYMKGEYNKSYWFNSPITLSSDNDLSNIYLQPVDGLYSGDSIAHMVIPESYPITWYRFSNNSSLTSAILTDVVIHPCYYEFANGLTNYVPASNIVTDIISNGIGTLVPEYDGNGDIIGYSFNITTEADYSPIFDYRPEDAEVPELDFDYSSDIPNVEFDNSTLSQLDVLDGGTALTWFYARFNELASGNVKVLALITSCLSLGFVSLILNKRV